MKLLDFEPSVMYNYIRSRQLEGTFPGSPKTGTWITTSMRIGKGWGFPEESQWPYDGDASHWPPAEPPDIDIEAKKHRILAYQRISSIDECRIVIDSGFFVVAGFKIDDSWFTPNLGHISMPENQSIVGGHAVALVGYDDNKQLFSFLNSWGASWGDNGIGYLPYQYFSDRFSEGMSIVALDYRQIDLTLKGINEINWGIKSLLDQMMHGVEFIDITSNDIIAWGFAIEHTDYIDIEELFVKPTWRKKGYGKKISSSFMQLSNSTGKSLRVMIPFSDDNPDNRIAVNSIISYLGLSIRKSNSKWISKIACNR